MKGYITRKDNHWYVVIYEGLDPATGRERRRWHAAGTDRAAAEAIKRQLAAAEHERRGTGRSRLTLAGHVARTWLPRKQRQLRPATLDGYRRQLRLYLLPALGHLPLRSLRVDHIETLYDQLLTCGRRDRQGGLSTKTVLEVHVLLRQILDDAVGRGLLTTNPARQALPPRHRRDQHRRRMAWTARELATFLIATSGHVHHQTFWLAAYTGLRRSELAGLRWRDIDLDHSRLSVTRTIVAVNGHPTVSNGKTGNAARTIDLDPSTVKLLHRWRNDHIGEFGTHDAERGLIARADGEPVNPQTLSQCFDRAVAKTTLPRISLHGLRHTHATLLLQAGVPLKVVSERLGHSTPAFTMATYQHVLPGMQAQAAATFANLLDHDVQEVADDDTA